MKKFIYIYQNGELVAIQNITGWFYKDIQKVIEYQILIGRTTVIRRQYHETVSDKTLTNDNQT